MYGNSGITQHRFGASRGDGDMCRFARAWIENRISKMIEVSLGRFVEDFVVAHGSL